MSLCFVAVQCKLMEAEADKITMYKQTEKWTSWLPAGCNHNTFFILSINLLVKWTWPISVNYQ